MATENIPLPFFDEYSFLKFVSVKSKIKFDSGKIGFSYPINYYMSNKYYNTRKSNG